MPGEFIFRLIVTAIVVIVLAIILIRSFRGKVDPSAKDSLEIMRERMERGEISEDVYEEAKRRRGKADK